MPQTEREEEKKKIASKVMSMADRARGLVDVKGGRLGATDPASSSSGILLQSLTPALLPLISEPGLITC